MFSSKGRTKKDFIDIILIFLMILSKELERVFFKKYELFQTLWWWNCGKMRDCCFEWMKDINPPIAFIFFEKRSGNILDRINNELFGRFKKYKLVKDHLVNLWNVGEKRERLWVLFVSGEKKKHNGVKSHFVHWFVKWEHTTNKQKI